MPHDHRHGYPFGDNSGLPDIGSNTIDPGAGLISPPPHGEDWLGGGAPDFDAGHGEDFGFHHGHGNPGTIAAGTGTLILGTTTTDVTTPITFGDGNYTLIDNEPNAVITGGNGDDSVTEIAAGGTITLGDGNMTVNAPAGGTVVTTGTGDASIALGGTGNTITAGPTNGGTADVSFIRAGSGGATVTAGDGNFVISAGGAGNTITVGTGNDVIHLGGEGCDDGGTINVTANTLNLGDGSNHVFLQGSGDTVYIGAGDDTIMAHDASNETFVVNAAGGTDVIAGFTAASGDVLDLSKILAGTAVLSDLSNIANFVSATATADPCHAAWTDTVLTITGAAASASVTLVNTGTLTLADLVSNNSLTVT